MRVEILNAVDCVGGTSQPPTLYRDLSALLESISQDGKVAAEKRVLRTLAFEPMSDRESRIAEAHKKTFEWVFDSRKTQFRPWLESESTGDVFWITGKPGSGKSTLMKFLCSHDRTKAALQAWAGSGNKLVIASHFFWALGSMKQRSQEGLLRSLLHDILRQCPSWISLVCSTQVLERIDRGDLSPWSLQELRQTLLNVFRAHRISTHVDGHNQASTFFCLFVDGLDEYAGQEVDLIEILASVACSTHVKICLASRPWPDFREAYTGDGSRMLKIHELTRQDIQHYITNELCYHPQVDGFKSHDGIRFSILVDEISQKAQGVFLWVYLVVRSLVRGLRKHDNIDTLKRRLAILPADLEGYYQHVLNGIETIYRKETAQLLEMLLCALEPLPLMCLGPALRVATHETINTDEARSISWAIDSNRSLQRQLHARCGDLVEVAPDPRVSAIAEHHCTDADSVVHCQYQVDFLHLTVRDFVRTSKVKQQLMGWIDGSFDPYFLICNCFLYLLKVLPDSIFEGYSTIEGYLDPNAEIDEYILSGLSQIGIYLREIESRCTDTSSALIKELLSLLTARNQGMIPWSNGPRDSVMKLPDDFLSWAIFQGLFGYVERKITQDPTCVDEFNRGTLLYHAAMDKGQSLLGKSDQPGNACLYILRTALLHGASPNEAVFTPSCNEPLTTWPDYLLQLLELSCDHLNSQRDSFDGQNRFFGSENLLARTVMLLENGADPNEVITGSSYYGSYHMSALQVFERIFRPEQVAVLKQRIDYPYYCSQWYFYKKD